MVPPFVDDCDNHSFRHFSSSDNNNKKFRPRRRPSPGYRPTKAAGKQARKDKKRQIDWSPGNDHKFVELGAGAAGGTGSPRDELEAEFGPLAADVIRDVRKEMASPDRSLDEVIEEYLRLADYMTAEDGSTEDLVGERRALAEAFGSNLRERDEFMESVNELITTGRFQNMGLVDQDGEPIPEEELGDHAKKENKTKSTRELLMEGMQSQDGDPSSSGGSLEDRDPSLALDKNQLAHGEWSEMLVGVDRNIKLWRGGRLESYRALVIGGNLNGCGGFGIGKALDPLVAVDVAGRHCKRNIFFVDRYQNDGLTSDLVGKQNSCVVTLRATDNGLRGNELCREILKRFGITNCVAKSHGNRNKYNVVRATFKALATHQSLEDIALKRGKRLVSIDRAMRMQV